MTIGQVDAAGEMRSALHKIQQQLALGPFNLHVAFDGQIAHPVHPLSVEGRSRVVVVVLVIVGDQLPGKPVQPLREAALADVGPVVGPGNEMPIAKPGILGPPS